MQSSSLNGTRISYSSAGTANSLLLMEYSEALKQSYQKRLLGHYRTHSHAAELTKLLVPQLKKEADSALSELAGENALER